MHEFCGYRPCREQTLAKSIADMVLRAHLETLKYAADHCVARNNYSIREDFHSLSAYYDFQDVSQIINPLSC
jgi:hypothetical protein